MAIGEIVRPAAGPAIDRAVQTALAFLLSARDREGWWRDFDIAGASTMWVTGYVGTVMTVLPDRRARDAAARAWELMRRQRWWASGWGYGAWVPADADSTAWALRLAENLSDRRSLRMRRGYAFLRRHVRPCGGLSTYTSMHAIRRFTRLSTDFDGWCAPHTCVTAAAAGLRGFSGQDVLLKHLRERQRRDGSWSGYWWYDPEYTTALAAEAISSEAHQDNRARLTRAVEWAAGRIGADGASSSPIEPLGSAFATACAVRVLVLGCHASAARHADELRRAVEWLLAAQQPDGAWLASARLRVPPPDLIDPEQLFVWGRNGRGAQSIGTIVVDRERVFTTATVLWALTLVRTLSDKHAA